MNVGILGTSYCGSTLLCYMLGYHYKIFSVGESHWLLDVVPRVNPKIRHDSCVICRELPDKKCPFYTDEFKASLTWGNMMKKISERAKEIYNKDICLYSDKHTSNYVRMLTHNKLDKAIILFKRPQGWAFSHLRHDKGFYPNMTRRQLLMRSLDTYINLYNDAERFCKENNIKPIYIFYEDLASYTEVILKKLCKDFGIRYQNRMLKYWENPDFHQIGGNGSPKISMFAENKYLKMYKGDTADNKWYRKIRKNIVLDERWMTELYPNEIGIIQRHACMERFKTLREKKI